MSDDGEMVVMGEIALAISPNNSDQLLTITQIDSNSDSPCNRGL